MVLRIAFLIEVVDLRVREMGRCRSFSSRSVGHDGIDTHLAQGTHFLRQLIEPDQQVLDPHVVMDVPSSEGTKETHYLCDLYSLRSRLYMQRSTMP